MAWSNLLNINGPKGDPGDPGGQGPIGPAGPAGATTWAGITDKPAAFPPEAHAHDVTDVTGLQTALDGKSDSGHVHTPASIGAAAASHGHAVADVTGLQGALDGKAALAGANFAGPVKIITNPGASPNYSSGQFTLESSNGSSVSMGWHRSGHTACQLRHDSNGLILSGVSTTTAADFYAYGNVTAFSDIRLKTDLQRIENALDKVEQLNGYTFLKTNEEGGRRHTGVVAQELLKVLPEAVSEQDGFYAVAYGNLAGLLIEAVKALHQRVRELEAR